MDAEDLLSIATQSLYRPSYDVEDMPGVDELLSQVALPTEIETERSDVRMNSLEHRDPVQPATKTRFGPVVSEEQILKAQAAVVPLNTKKNTNWVVNVWNEWADYRKKQRPNDYPPYILTMEIGELDYWLSRFVLEVCRKDGNCYPSNTLHQLCCGILRFLREVKPSIDTFKNPEFASFRKTLDAEMKHLEATQDVSKGAKKAEPLSATDEEILWEKGLLGPDSPQTLIDTMVS